VLLLDAADCTALLPGDAAASAVLMAAPVEMEATAPDIPSVAVAKAFLFFGFQKGRCEID
jgi:hypothetical protein